MMRCELSIPLVDGILISHAQVTTRANRNQILDCHVTALTLRSVMTALIIKYVHLVRTPDNLTLRIELATHFQ
jgi:hypothetical protein